MKLHPILQRIYDTEKVLDKDGNERDAFGPCLSIQDGAALQDCIRRYNTKRTLEIGCAYGASALYMCEALSEIGGCHEAIDPYQRDIWEDIGVQTIEKAGFSDIFTLHRSFSSDILPQFLVAGEKFDFIFIDGCHLFDYVMTDFFYADKLVEPGKHIMLHDMHYPSVRKAVAYILRNMHYELAMEPFLKKPSFLGWLYTTSRLAATSPLDPGTWYLASIWWQGNFCVVRKLKNEDRDHNLYTPF